MMRQLKAIRCFPNKKSENKRTELWRASFTGQKEDEKLARETNRVHRKPKNKISETNGRTGP